MLENEIDKLRDLEIVGKALVEYAKTLIEDLNFYADSQGRYVATPHNFITFKVHWQRANNLTVTLRGNPEEFATLPELALSRDQAGYSSFKLKEKKQLCAATLYVRRSAEIYERGRERVQKGQSIVES